MELLGKSDARRLAEIGITEDDYWNPDGEDENQPGNDYGVAVHSDTLARDAILNQNRQRYAQPQPTQYE